MKDENKIKMNGLKNQYYYSTIVGILFILFGIIQILVSLNLFGILGEILNVPKDIIGSFILILLGLIFLYGVYETQHGVREGVAYTYVGIMLSLFFMGIYLLILIISIIEFIINSDFSSIPEIIMSEFKPIIYLGLLSVVGIIIWRKKFSKKQISS
jgi:hypothetical protein